MALRVKQQQMGREGEQERERTTVKPGIHSTFSTKKYMLPSYLQRVVFIRETICIRETKPGGAYGDFGLYVIKVLVTVTRTLMTYNPKSP